MADSPGLTLKVEVLRDFDLNPAELLVLDEAAAVADALAHINREVAGLERLVVEGSRGQEVEHPLLSAQRAHAAVLARLLAELALPMPGEDEGDGLRSRAARKAARARWEKGK